MLGNFSFGDYFKHEIIPWAWGVPHGARRPRARPASTRLYTSTTTRPSTSGTRRSACPRTGFSVSAPTTTSGAAGPVGPCGPCSEIIYDQGPEFSCGKPTCTVGCDCDRYLEIWNLVFMQYNRDEAGNLTPLPHKNIDTGMGLERLTSVVQRVPNDFETDLFRPIMDKACELVNVKYGEDPKKGHGCQGHLRPHPRLGVHDRRRNPADERRRRLRPSPPYQALRALRKAARYRQAVS